LALEILIFLGLAYPAFWEIHACRWRHLSFDICHFYRVDLSASNQQQTGSKIAYTSKSKQITNLRLSKSYSLYQLSEK